MSEINNTYPRIILGLDISTACIGASIVLDKGINEKPEILKITHIAPKISSKIKGIESLFIKKQIFEDEFISTLKKYNITDVIIEEPLLSSNNVNTVATLLRFNGMISESIYKNLKLVPNFISSYDARMFSFPELISIRKYNKKGEEYSLQHIKNALKNNNIVLFGSYPFDIDKKTIMMNKVNENYNGIEWVTNNKGKLKKENFDACDSLICTLAYININHYGIEAPKIVDYNIQTNEATNEYEVQYRTQIWNKIYSKILTLKKP